MPDARPVRPRSRWSTAVWTFVAAYSIARFAYTAVWIAWTSVAGDFSSAFPSPLTLGVSQRFPGLMGPWIQGSLAWHSWGDGSWNYGPALHVITLPFAFAPTHLTALRLILIVNLACAAATFFLWTRRLLPALPATAIVAVLCIWLNHFPLLEALVGREVEVFELFLITLAIVWLRRGREAPAGAAIGLAAMIKFLPVLLVPYLIVKGFRRAAAAALVTIAAFAILAQVTLGWQRSVTLLQLVEETRTAVYPTAYANQAIANVLYKTFTAFNLDDPRPPTLYPRALRIAGAILNALVLAATAWFVVRWRRSRLIEIECALLLIVMCLLPSHANTYYFVFALPALTIAAAAVWQRPAARVPWLTPALAASVALMGFLLPMKAYEIASGIPGMLVARALQGWSLPFYGAILACGLMVELHRRERGDSLA